MEFVTNEFKTKVFQEIIKNEVEADIIYLKTEKMKLRNVIINNSYNISLNTSNECNSDYRKVENITQNLVKEKKKKINISHSFNIAPANPLKVGQTIPVKFVYLNSKVFPLPCNKINIIFFFSRHFLFNKEKMERLLKAIQNNFVSTFHISLRNFESDGLMEYSTEYINLMRQFNVKQSSSIVYDSKYKVTWVGNIIDLLEEKTIQEILQNNNNDYYTEVEKESVISQLSKLSINNHNVINEENKYDYLGLKEEMKKLNRKYLREMKCKLKNVEIKLTRLKRYVMSPVNRLQKIIYKPNIEYNENATIKDKTGKYIDNLIMNYHSVMNFITHDDEEDYKKYIQCAVEYFFSSILIPHNLVNKIKLGIKCEEKLGLSSRSLKYTVYNINPFSDFVGLDVYYGVILHNSANFKITSNKELSDAVVIKTSFFPENLRKIVVPYLDENLVEKDLEILPGEVTILNLLTLYNPVFLQMISSSIPIIEKIRRVSTNVTLPKINSYIAIFSDKESMETIKSSPDYIKFKEYAKGEMEVLFVDPVSHALTWMQYCNLDEIGATIICPSGQRKHIVADGMMFIESEIKSAIFHSKTYEIDKNTYEELKEYGKKLVKVKMSDLGYNPFLLVNLEHVSEYGPILKDIKFTVSFISKIRRRDKNSITPFINKIKQIMKLEEELNFYEELSDVVDIELGTQCYKCEKSLNGFGELQYYCYWCKIYFCGDCGDKYDTTQTEIPSQLPHHHFLTSINIKNLSGMKNIDTYKFGFNIWDKFYSPDSILNTFNCNGCCETMYTYRIRYVCITCRPGCLKGYGEDTQSCGFVDFCEKCFKSMMDGSWKDNQKMVGEIAKDEHDCDNHVYMRIDCPTGNYSIY